MAKSATGLWEKLKAPSAEDVGANRWRKIFISLGSTFSSRVLAQICNLLMIPIALRYLGAERYGVWMTLTSALSLLAFFDFGIGIGLQNRAAEMLGKDKLDQLNRCLRSTLVVLALISGMIFTAVLFCIYQTPFVPLFFHGASFAQIDLRHVLVIIAGAFMLGLPLSLFPRVAFGLQLGWIASISATCGTVLSLAAVFAAALFRAEFTTFVAVTIVPPIATQIVGYFFLTRRVPGGLPLFGAISFRDGIKTLQQGSHYVLPQVTGAIMMQGPMVVLGTYSSPLNAATFSILTRLGMPFLQLQQMFLAQIWPAITEALHRDDTEWLRKTLQRVMRANLLFGTIAAAVVVLTVIWLFPLLTRDVSLKPSLLVVLLYATLVGLMCIVQGLSSIANGLCRMRLQNYLAFISIPFALLVFPLATTHSGLNGVLGAMLVLNGVFTIPFLYWEYRLYLAHVEKPRPISAPVEVETGVTLS